MIGTLQCIVLDCPEPRKLAEFYQQVVGGGVDVPDRRWLLGEQWSTLHTDGGLVLAFQQVEPYLPPRWPDPEHPQQFHLDLGVPDLDRAQEAVLGAGARLLESTPGWRVYADPAGHPFCLVRH